MFIALRDLACAKGRFSLMNRVVALIAYPMVFLSGLSVGVISNNLAGLIAAPVTRSSPAKWQEATYGPPVQGD